MANKVTTKAMLFEQLKAHSDKIRSFGVKELGVFGSFITGKISDDSDVDFLVEFEPAKKNYDNYMDLSFYLEDLLNRKIEIVTPQSLSQYIGPHILSQTQYVNL